MNFKLALEEMPKEVYDEEYEVTDWFENNYPVIREALIKSVRLKEEMEKSQEVKS